MYFYNQKIYIFPGTIRACNGSNTFTFGSIVFAELVDWLKIPKSLATCLANKWGQGFM